MILQLGTIDKENILNSFGICIFFIEKTDSEYCCLYHHTKQFFRQYFFFKVYGGIKIKDEVK